MKNKIFLVTIFLVIAGVLFIYNGSFLSASLTQPQKETQITLPESKEDSNNAKAVNKSKKNNKTTNKEQENEVLSLKKVNEMKKEDLMQIDDVGEITAKKILKAKEIENREDLMKIDGIGKATTEKIEEYVSSWDKNDQINSNNKSNKKEVENEFKAETESSVTLTKKELEIIFRAMKKSEKDLTDKDPKKNKILAVESKNNSRPKEIDLNTANLKQLQKLIGIGPAYANQIIRARPFCSVDELVRVNGIGHNTLKNIKDQSLAVASCSNSNQNNNDKTTANKNLKEKINEKKEEIEDLREEMEELKEENKDLEEENENLKEEIDDLEDSLENSRNRLNNESNNDKSLKKKLKSARVKRDACGFESQININKANKEDLINVDGVGDSISEDILNFIANSPITYFEQLKEIDGVGSVVVDNFIDSNFCAGDPIIDNDDDGDNGGSGGGNSEVNEFNVSFKETNDLKNVEIKLYEDQSHSNLAETITTNDNGEVEQELEEGDYWFVANLENYEDYTGNFSLSEKKEIKFKLTPASQSQNLLENYYLNNWSNDSINNWNWDNRKALKNNNPLINGNSYFEHEPYSSYKDLTQSVSLEKNTNYYVKVWIKGKGKIKTGFIKDDQENWNSHSYTELNTTDWKELSFQIEDNQFKNAKFALRLKRLSNTGESLSIGAVWLSKDNPPGGWPNQQQ